MDENLNKIADSLKNIDKIANSLLSINNHMEELNQTCLILVGNLETMNQVEFSNVLGGIADIVSIGTAIGVAVSTFGEAVASTGSMGAALASIAGPVGIAVAAIGTVVGAVVLFSNYESEATKETRLFNEAQEAKRNELAETAKAINDSTNSAVSSAKTAEVQSEVLKGFVSNLKELADEKGYVTNFEEAQYYVDKLNSSMPGTVELTEDGKLSWLQNADAIDENIKQLERKAKIDAYYDGYVESLKNETKLRSELTLAQNNYNSELEKQQGYQSAIDELQAKYQEQGYLSKEDCNLMGNYTTLLGESSNKLSEYSETLDTAKGAYEANAKGAELYQQAVGSLDGSVTASALLQAEEYTALEENGTSIWGSLAVASEDCKNRIATAQGEELMTIQATSKLMKDEMVNKALEQGMTYNQMIEELEKNGVKMNETEKAQLLDRYNLWDMNSKNIKNAEAKGLDTLRLMKMTSLSEMNEEEKIKLADNVKLFASSGDKSGIELCNKLATSLEANNGQVNDETKSIMDQIEARAREANPTTQVNVDAPSDKDINDVNSKINQVPDKKNVEATITAKADKKSFSIFGITIPWLAEGGFPETGQLFVAREAGPELVGRINGKTAVANNDQIVSGISSGVYNAVRSAMAGNGGSGSMNLNATFVMDGEVVGKQVIKYHNGVVKRTGSTPLMI